MKAAIIVPYRDRLMHLRIFAPAIIKKLGVPVLVIEQTDGKPFNRAKLLNIGSSIAIEHGVNFIITHDVDMIPNEETVYQAAPCGHLATAASQFGGKMPYDRYFGGVNVFSSELFQAVNGYSNEYWGWGAEDDDMLLRCEAVGAKVFRPVQPNFFMSLTHPHGLEMAGARDTHRLNSERLSSGYDTSLDGLSNLDFKVVGEREEFGCRIITVEI